MTYFLRDLPFGGPPAFLSAATNSFPIFFGIPIFDLPAAAIRIALAWRLVELGIAQLLLDLE